MDIENNVLIRKQVKDLWGFIDDESSALGNEKRFWESFCEEFNSRFPVEIPSGAVQPMTDEESRAFDNEVCPFRPWQGRKVRDVPLQFFLWLDDQPDFRSMVKRYLASERIQREQEENINARTSNT